jgi:hypothetical protein
MSMVAGAPRSDPGRGGRARQRDRRHGLASLLASLAPALRRPEPNGLRAIFEEGARRLVGADSVRLRDRTDPPDATLARASRGLALDVPTSESGRPAVLEASSPPLRRFDDWDVQMLQLASQLAALVVEVERTRGSGPRAGATADGAAPLIGSTPAMRTLRHKIERVAATDFTVLIEGESGPEAHSGLEV